MLSHDKFLNHDKNVVKQQLLSLQQQLILQQYLPRRMLFTTFVCTCTKKQGLHFIKERFVIIIRRNLDNFNLFDNKQGAHVSVISTPAVGVLYTFGVGYCLLQTGGQSRASTW